MFLRCLGKAVLRDCGLSWISISFNFKWQITSAVFRYYQLSGVSGFHHHSTCFRTKSSTSCTQVLQYLHMDLVKNHIYLMIQRIISRVLNIVLDRYEKKSRLKNALFKCLSVLRFYGPVNPIGSCRARSVYLTTRLLGRLSPLSG